ncbi:hypothetical protein PYCCODRAFT_1358774 [Trametes coccinea BRFM310]|uniref:Arrestin-like N-terminal domain-containing protein n=1 Tax=Trametes coccinea (strain BRFM310) TaxID=1353009 RepID=A0A1Y2J1M3_TRAC3|nr:hypothetical protein PYCCODRAFT_1358774 [Trametes coccinea BRFM310]
MRHPYAAISASRPASLLSTHSRSSSPEPEREPPLPVPQLNRRRPSQMAPHEIDRPRTAPPEKGLRAVVGHFVKHSRRVTVLLSGHPDGVDVPIYSNGQTIEGVLAVTRSSGLLAVEVKIEGAVTIQEIGGSGSRTVPLIDQTVYSWIPAAEGSLFPPSTSFRYTLPESFLDTASGNCYALPPTYSASLEGMPGFVVDIAYAVVVYITRQRQAATLWRGTSRTVVPFRYQHRTRPALPGPFPCLLQRTEDKPRTLFVFNMRAWSVSLPCIKVHVYLPASQVCSIQEPIPFHISLLGDERAIEPFAAYRPAPASFLPLPRGPSSSLESLASVRVLRGAVPRKATPMQKCPLSLRIQRTTVVDTRPTPEDDGKSHLYHTEWIGEGTVHSVRSNGRSLVWSGAIDIPPEVAAQGGGFEINGLKVVDSIALSVEPPSGCRRRYIPLNEAIPLQLTSDAYTTSYFAAVPVSLPMPIMPVA